MHSPCDTPPFRCDLEDPRGAGGGGGESREDPPLLDDCSVNTVRPDLEKLKPIKFENTKIFMKICVILMIILCFFKQRNLL